MTRRPRMDTKGQSLQAQGVARLRRKARRMAMHHGYDILTLAAIKSGGGAGLTQPDPSSKPKAMGRCIVHQRQAVS